ncbi:MAG: reverse transcriptase domain-containing protein [Prochlorotrichaceae cyanobacterium]|jgi:retron-type reverse transcriptase
MKRYGNLWQTIISFDNLLLATKKAQKNKRYYPNVLKFNFNFESEILKLQQELKQQTYTPRSYRTFEIKAPKPRLISAAPYRDRVVHHALCNVISPILEKHLIDHTYANRVGFGTHKALKQFTQFARSSVYSLQCDICKYFPSIDHQILKDLLRRKIKCTDTLWLIDKIIDNSNPQFPVNLHFPGDDLLTPLQRRRGLPIGNLTSQTFANFYLSSFDHFVKEKLKVKKYLRYVDDFALFSDSQSELKDIQAELPQFLANLRLTLHPQKNQILSTRKGVNFVGFRVFPEVIRVRSNNLHQGRKRLKQNLFYRKYDVITDIDFQRSLNGWFAHLDHGDTWLLKQQILTSLPPE